MSVGLPDWDDLFFGAALEPERWPGALAEMAAHIGSSHGQLIGVGDGRDLLFNIVNDFDDSHTRALIEFGGATPAENFRIAASSQGIAQGNFDEVLYEKHYDAAALSLRSSRYIDWCEAADIPYGCQTNLIVDRGGLVGLAALRKRKEGRTTETHRRMFAKASEAARRAVRLQERLEGDHARLLAGTFDAISATAFILDARGRLQAMTEGAERIVSAGGVALRSGQLEGRGTPLSLSQAVRALTSDKGLNHLRLRIDQPKDEAPLFFEGFRMPQRGWSLGHLPHAILLAKTPRRDRAGIAAFLSAIYQLTPAEADIAMRHFDGATRAQIADMRNVTEETLRGQTKSIYAKMDCHTATDLMRALSAIMA